MHTTNLLQTWLSWDQIKESKMELVTERWFDSDWQLVSGLMWFVRSWAGITQQCCSYAKPVRRMTFTWATVAALLLHHDRSICMDWLGVRQWWPQTMMATKIPMMATNMFSVAGMSVNSQWIWQFLKSTPLVFTFSLLRPSWYIGTLAIVSTS